MADAARVVLASPGGRRGRGGMASLVTYLADALPARLPGWRIEVLDTYGPGAFWRMPLRFALALAQVVRAPPDLLHIHMACYGSAVRKPILAWLARRRGARVVLHLHGADFDDYCRALPAWRRRWLVTILRSVDRIVVIGSHWRGFVIDELGLDPERVVLIHNGVPGMPPSAPAPASPPLLLTLGELGVRKGTPELIRALGAPALLQRAWRAVVAGDGAVDASRAAVREAGVAARVDLPGWQSADAVRTLLRSAAMLVLPSRQEGLPVAILEAMAAGVPVIATPVGAVRDAIEDGDTGLLVPPGDSDALARAIVRLLDDPALSASLAARARARFEARFTIDRTADQVAALYREVLAL